jgi:hypothetical protein
MLDFLASRREKKGWETLPDHLTTSDACNFLKVAQHQPSAGLLAVGFTILISSKCRTCSAQHAAAFESPRLQPPLLLLLLLYEEMLDSSPLEHGSVARTSVVYPPTWGCGCTLSCIRICAWTGTCCLRLTFDLGSEVDHVIDNGALLGTQFLSDKRHPADRTNCIITMIHRL